MPEADVAMVVLHAFAQQLGAILRLQQIRRAVRIGRVVLALPPLVVFEPRLRVVNPPAVGPAVEFHLQHAQVEPQLESSARPRPRSPGR